MRTWRDPLLHENIGRPLRPSKSGVFNPSNLSLIPLPAHIFLPFHKLMCIHVCKLCAPYEPLIHHIYHHRMIKGSENHFFKRVHVNKKFYLLQNCKSYKCLVHEKESFFLFLWMENICRRFFSSFYTRIVTRISECEEKNSLVFFMTAMMTMMAIYFYYIP